VAALALTVVAQWEVWAGGELDGSRSVRHTAVAAVCVAACTGAVAARRAAPTRAALVAAVAVVLAALTGTAVDVVAVVLAQLVLVYSVAEARAPGVAVPVAAATAASSIPVAQDASDVAFFAALCTAALAAGVVVRRQRRLADALATTNASLASERELTRRLAADAERGRIARDMHDVLAHSLGIVVVQAEAADDALDRDHDAVSAALQAIAGTARQSLGELRRLLAGLRSDEMAAASLADLSSLVDVYRSAGLRIELRQEPTRPVIDPAVDATAYLITREALTNVLRHADGAPTVVEVTRDDSMLVVEVRDHGPGRRGSADGLRDGHGVLGMRERAALVDGDLECGEVEGGGFRVRARLPLSRATT
jgi:signal transduction histidine kinase